jgi:hypothetical protein
VADWAGFLALAERLAAIDGEAELRSAVSRAYYSAYNDARRFVGSQEPMYSFRDEDHWKVWEWFARQPGQAPQVSTLGQQLRRKRNAADYRSLSNYKAEAAAAVRTARKILELIESFQ